MAMSIYFLFARIFSFFVTSVHQVTILELIVNYHNFFYPIRTSYIYFLCAYKNILCISPKPHLGLL